MARSKPLPRDRRPFPPGFVKSPARMTPDEQAQEEAIRLRFRAAWQQEEAAHQQRQDALITESVQAYIDAGLWVARDE